MAKIAMLHTSFVFLNNETAIQELVSELLPGDELIHFVDSDVLATVISDGEITENSKARMLHLAEAAERAGADVIFSACSSLGPAIDAAKPSISIPMVKIDDAMTALAARVGTRIGVLATVPTTLGPTAALIEQAASATGKEIQIEQKLAEGAFALLTGGDREGHDALVSARAAELKESGVDLIVLAQASMSRLGPRLETETGLRVLVSPRLGVEGLASVVHASSSAGSAIRHEE